MTTSYEKDKIQSGVFQSGYEKDAPDADFEIPSCGVQDVDRALFSLFSERLPLLYQTSKDESENKRLPVIFASGERFAMLSKQSPIRDKNGALILPIMSIARSNIEFETTKGQGISDRYPETVIKRLISKDTSQYKELLNSKKMFHSKYSRPDLFPVKNSITSTGHELGPEVEDNIYEYITIPTPKYFTAKYEITIWCQYIQQLNEFLEIILGSFPQPNGRSIRIDSPKGYWFVAHFDQTISQDNNFSDYSDSERLIKATMNVEVPGYLILKSDYIPNSVKRYTTATKISFSIETDGVNRIVNNAKNKNSSLKSQDYNKYILNDSFTENDELPTDGIEKTNEYVQYEEAFDRMGAINEENKDKTIRDIEYMTNNNKAGRVRVHDPK
jgi:hypothetical protein